MEGLFLGIDVGGTGSRWTVVSEEGTLAERGVALGATGHLFNAAERERFSKMVAEIAGGLRSRVSAVHLGVTGLGEGAMPAARAITARAFDLPEGAVTSSDDMELAYGALFRPGEGHLVAAGTGSIGLHITTGGERIRVGGRGMLVDDGGSGTWIVLTAINRLYRLIDETGDVDGATELATRIHAGVGGASWDAVRTFVYGSDRGRIGQLAQAVAAAAGAGDGLAIDILHAAVVEIARLAHALIRRIGNLPVAFIGGVIDLHPGIRSGLKRELEDVEVRFPRSDASFHAARLARAHMLGAEP
jgi:N-acetylglucosamine kinase-like BadF-type ATPase